MHLIVERNCRYFHSTTDRHFYFENKKETIKVINTKDSYVRFNPETVYKKDADKAMKRYTAKLREEKYEDKKCKSEGEKPSESGQG